MVTQPGNGYDGRCIAGFIPGALNSDEERLIPTLLSQGKHHISPGGNLWFSNVFWT